MRKIALLSLVVALWGFAETTAHAQVGYVTYYQPAYQPVPPVYQPVTVYRPAPVAYTSYRPVPVAYTSYYAARPVVSTQAVVPAPVYYQSEARVRTRYRPILGGTVTRIAPRYRAYYAPVPVVYGY